MPSGNNTVTPIQHSQIKFAKLLNSVRKHPPNDRPISSS
jgi:hypothetical protein